jgi:hypothetical protein
MDANATVPDGVLVDLSLWGTTIIGLAIHAQTENISARLEHRIFAATKVKG